MVGVVAVFEVGDADFGVEQGKPLVHVQALVANSVVERLDEPVTPSLTPTGWVAWRNIPDPDQVFAELAEGFGDQFGAVVATDQHGHTPIRNDRLKRGDEVLASDRTGRQIEQRFSCVCVHRPSKRS